MHRVKEKRNILQTKRKKGDWIGHILRRDCLLKHVIEGKIEGRIEAKERRRRRRKQLLDDLNTLRRTGLLNCLNARSWGLTFRQHVSCI